jgi:hypothetical protein
MCHQLNAIDNAVWSAGEWWSTLQSQTGPKFERGRWSAIYVREGDAWKIRLFTVSERSKPAQLLRRSSSIKSACAAGVENAQRIEQFSDAELLEELKRRNVPHTVFCGINHKEELDQLCVERLIAFQIGDAAIEV